MSQGQHSHLALKCVQMLWRCLHGHRFFCSCQDSVIGLLLIRHDCMSAQTQRLTSRIDGFMLMLQELHRVVWLFKWTNNETFAGDFDSDTCSQQHQVGFISLHGRGANMTQLKHGAKPAVYFYVFLIPLESCSVVSFNWVTRIAVKSPQGIN